MREAEIPDGVQIAPSLLAADFAHLAREIRSVEEAGVALLHLDVMDGAFVPNITFGPGLVASVRSVTRLFLDVHLMIRDPLGLAGAFARAGADLLTFHAEALGDPARGLRDVRAALREQGCRLGLAFRPATDPAPWLQAVGGDLDLALVMTVEPGFGGQAFLEGQMPRVRDAAALRETRGWSYRIEVDGGITPSTARAAAAAGAEILVAGPAVFGSRDRRSAGGRIREAALDRSLDSRL
jgi:ribulose-phosphate 3-epimerase